MAAERSSNRTGQRRRTPSAPRLRPIWEPAGQALPRDTNTVIIAPDGRLTAIRLTEVASWPIGPGTVLLEQSCSDQRPSRRPFLLENVHRAGTRGRADREILLAPWGRGLSTSTQADRRREDPDRPAGKRAAPAETERGRGDGWNDLPGTLQELNAVVAAAGPRNLVRLEGPQASTVQVLREMPCRKAPLGPYRHPRLFRRPQSSRQFCGPTPRLFASTRFAGELPSERVPARATLWCSQGSVLAGASRPQSTVPLSGLDRDDRGILTAEAIAGLDLAGMELSVLSACETGLGLVACGGEGVFGLQPRLPPGGPLTM